MRTAARLLAGLVAPLLVLSLAGCGDDDSDKSEPVLSEQQARAVLLTASDVGPRYRKQPADDDDEADNEGLDCLSAAARAFNSEKGATEVEVEYRKRVDARRGAGVTVLSGVSSYAETDRAETSLNELRDAMLDCETAEFEQDGATVRFDISVSDGRTSDELDQQVNLELDGDITIGETTLPLVVQLRYFRIGNHGGTLSVTLVNAPDQTGEVDRLLKLSVRRFLAAADSAA